MKEWEDIYVVVVEKCTLDGANTFTSIKHKHEGHTHEWGHHDYYNVALQWLPSTPIYEVHDWEAVKELGSFRVQSSQGRSHLKCTTVLGTVNNSYKKSFALGNMYNVVLWFIEAKCVAGKVKPQQENGLKLSHWTFAVFTFI